MIVRAVDDDKDWQFGKGKNDYKRSLKGLSQHIETRLMSVLGDCFFNTTAGINWFNLLGAKDTRALSLAVGSVILNTQNVTGLLQLSLNVDAKRKITITYKVQTTLGQAGNTFQYDVNGLG